MNATEQSAPWRRRMLRRLCRDYGHDRFRGQCRRCGFLFDMKEVIEDIMQRNLHLLTGRPTAKGAER